MDVYNYYSSLYWFMSKGDASKIEELKKIDCYDFYKYLTIYEAEIDKVNKENKKNGRS